MLIIYILWILPILIFTQVWECLYKPNETAKKEEYEQKKYVAQEYCQLHIEHRSSIQAQKRFDSGVTDSKMTEQFIKALPQRTAMKAAPRRWSANDLRPFIIKPVQEQVEGNQPLDYLTEMREVTIQFINIVPASFQEHKLTAMVNSAYQIVCNIIDRVHGVVNKVSLFDKDAMMLVLFGLRGIKHELESQNALKSAFKIRHAIASLENVSSVSVGVTIGLVYCGVVGHPLRKEYTVIGGAVNKAARIMCAYENKVTCDHKTYVNSKLASFYFQLQPALKLKGIEDAGHIFEYNEKFEDRLRHHKVVTPIIGREDELDLVNLIISHPKKAEGYRGVLFHGKSKIGKSRLLTAVLQSCNRRGNTVASVYLCGSSHRPYYCVSMLYKQLYDAKTKVDSKATGLIKNIPRNLWNLNEILQKSISKKTDIFEMFTTLVRDGKRGFSVVIVDNLQHIDKQSLDVLEKTINRGYLRLVCAGQFEMDTWDIQWRMSLNNRIKLIELEPLNREQIAPLICQFLSVKGVHKKIVSLAVKSCEGRPGWVQTCLLGQINRGWLEVRYVLKNQENTDTYIFPDENVLKIKPELSESMHDEVAAVPVVELCGKLDLSSNVLTLAAISMDLFDSFTPYEQLVIKTAAVLGDVFTRSLITVMLKYPNQQTLLTTIQHLFEEEVFDCGAKYISTGGLPDHKLTCHCYVNEEEMQFIKECKSMFPKYALCKVIHFKNKSLRTVAYELLPLNQRKELHLRITDVLEYQNNSCPNCLRDNSAAIVKMRTFKDIMQYCNDPTKIYGAHPRSESDEECDPENIKIVIREAIRKKEMEGQGDTARRTSVDIPKRKVWDPATCFCLEILTKVYSDLIHHSKHAGHLGKRIFFLVQYGIILSTMNECEEAIPYLDEASELCMAGSKHRKSVLSDTFRKLQIGKIHMLLAEAKFKLNEIEAAKTHIAISLRQYNVPLIALNYTLMNKLLNRFWLTSEKNMELLRPPMRNALMKSDFSRCLSLLSNIFAAQGHWDLAKKSAARSLSLLRESNSNIAIICDVYSNAIDLYNICGDTHTCEKLERCIKREILRKYTGNVTIELYALCKLIYVLFQVRVLSGNIEASIKIGYRSMHATNTIHAFLIQMQILPVLATMLLLVQRIDDAVGIGRLLRNIGRTHDATALVGYYAFCVELNVETSFTLEPIDLCDQFAKNYFSGLSDTEFYTPIEIKLIIYLVCYYARKCKWNQALKWKNLYKPEQTDRTNFISVYNHLKFTECSLLFLVRSMQQKDYLISIEESKMNLLLADCEKAANKWKSFLPRTLHYKAYYSQIKENTKQAKNYLKRALKEAKANKNVLDECWITLNKNCWDGGFHFGDDMKNIHWKLSRNYTPMEWSQIMYALPHNTA